MLTPEGRQCSQVALALFSGIGLHHGSAYPTTRYLVGRIFVAVVTDWVLEGDKMRH